MRAQTNRQRIIALLAHRLWIPLVVLVGVLLCSPSLGNGFYTDDYNHLIMVNGLDSHRSETSPFDLYALVPDDPSFRERGIDSGAFPWWTSDHLTIAFWRPLSSLSLYLDYRAWPDNPMVMHVHSLLWLTLLLVVVGVIYRRFFTAGWIAGLAVALYALDDAQLFPVSWIAGRNGLIATTLALLVLVAHDRWRRQGWRAGAGVAPLLLLIALLAGEFALGVMGFILSYALFLDDVHWKKRLLSLAPYIGIVALWQIVYSLLGYGTADSGMYIHPVYQPAAFIVAVGQRLPLLLLGLFGFPPSEMHMILPETMRPAHIVFAIAFIGLVSVVLWPLLRRDAKARFWALGTLLALIPACAGYPNDRLLLIAGVGGMGLVAQFFGLFLEKPDWRPKAFRWRIPAVVVLGIFIIVHLVLSPLSTPYRSTMVGTLGRSIERATRSLEVSPGFSQRTVVLVNAPDWAYGGGILRIRTALGLENPRRFESLANSLAPTLITREDERSLSIYIEGGHLNTWLHSVFRHPDDRWRVGQHIDRDNVSYHIVSITSDFQPETVRVTFDQTLEHQSLQFIIWEPGAYVEFELPRVGESVTIDLDDSYLTNPERPADGGD